MNFETKKDNSATFYVRESTRTVGPFSTESQAASGNQQYWFMMVPKTGQINGSVPSQGWVWSPVLPPLSTIVRLPIATPPSCTRQPIRPSIRGTPSQPVRGRTPPARETTTSKSSPKVVVLTKDGVESLPVLSVLAKQQRTVQVASAKRPGFDAKVMGLLVHVHTKWLIQQGLVRSEQYESVPRIGKVKPKLGMNSYGSICETRATSLPSTVLLIYHWSFLTIIPNLNQWVKVDNMQVEEFFQKLKSVSVGAVETNILSFGKNVEIGVICLEITKADGPDREVTVEEVLGQIRNQRLGATQTKQESNQAKRYRYSSLNEKCRIRYPFRFGNIYEPLPIWIHPGCTIVPDFSVYEEAYGPSMLERAYRQYKLSPLEGWLFGEMEMLTQLKVEDTLTRKDIIMIREAILADEINGFSEMRGRASHLQLIF